MRSLMDLHQEGEGGKKFAELFAGNPHGGRWSIAEDHWERTVRELLHRSVEMEKLSRREAVRKAETVAQGFLWGLAKVGRCPWCG
ncbi:DUF6313 family protein [Nonomuraea sp. M3C6]|uniref:DUF6313 family protein n=1 Tax=Nonomuraea marmarensis TaxID=3351344 RepID=A0ABW7AUD9_9ACTN